jgi:hypothetical protein
MNKKITIALAVVLGIILISTLVSSPEEVLVVDTKTDILPSAVTNDFPTYPDTTLINQSQTTGEDGRIFYSFSLEAEASIKEINEWYRESLSRGGWTIKSDRTIAGYQVIQAEKENLFVSMQAAGGSSSNTSVISQQAQIRP